MSTLRHFHLGEPGARSTLGKVSSEFLPVSLNNFRDASKVRYDYPLCLFPAETAGDVLAKPLSRFLGDAVEGFAPATENARILKDNLAWIEREICSKLRGQEAPVDAAPLVADAAKALQKQLGLKGEHVERLQGDLDQLVAAVDAGSQFLGYGRLAAVHLLLHVARCKSAPRRAAFGQEVAQLAAEMKALLAVEKSKLAAARKSTAIKQSIGASNSYFNTTAMSKMMNHSQGSSSMAIARRRRIEGALEVLEAYQSDPIVMRAVHTENLGETLLEEAADFESVTDADPCAEAALIFDAEAEKLAKVFAALRIARLESRDSYKPAIHDAWFKNFGWEGFSKEELLQWLPNPLRHVMNIC